VGQLYFVAEGGGWTTAKEYARAGLGVAIMPLATLTGADQKQLVCRQLAPQFAIADFLVGRRDERNPLLSRISNTIVAAASIIAKEHAVNWQ